MTHTRTRPGGAESGDIDCWAAIGTSDSPTRPKYQAPSSDAAALCFCGIDPGLSGAIDGLTGFQKLL